MYLNAFIVDMILGSLCLALITLEFGCFGQSMENKFPVLETDLME